MMRESSSSISTKAISSISAYTRSTFRWWRIIGWRLLYWSTIFRRWDFYDSWN